MQNHPERACADSETDLSRRDFVRRVGGTAAAFSAIPMLGSSVQGAPSAKDSAETAVAAFHGSLTPKQRETICFPFDHNLRSRINANWHVTKPVIGDEFYTDEQRELIRGIVKGITSEEGFTRVQKQMEEDAGGMEFYSVAMFGDPASSKFEWELTGRHLTMRADGNSVDHAAFGGPIVYGHGEDDPSDNLYFYQTKQVNKVFAALNGKQIKQALVAKAPRENDVKLQGSGGSFAGLSVSELTADQVELFEQTLKTLLAPYRAADVDEAIAIIKAAGGLESLNMAFYKQGDLGNDQVWDIWRIEGPSLVWHFRGAPHVHAYINIGQVKG